MTNTELLAKIKAEIERLIQESDFDESANLHGLLSFLDTLEEPVCDDIEEAAKNHIREVVDAGWEWETQDIADAFKAGANWQKEQMMKEGNVILAEEDFDAAKEKEMEWGYNLCKEQMLKNAVEGVVEYNFDETGNGYYCIRPTYVEECVGNKVKLIIVKEEEK